jgi:hypothetical protein
MAIGRPVQETGSSVAVNQPDRGNIQSESA